MDTYKMELKALTANLMLLVVLLTFVSATSASEESNMVIPQHASAAIATLAPTVAISGTYQGTVAITEPVQLGVLDLAFDITGLGDVFTGTVNVSNTLVFSTTPAPELYGVVSGTLNGITPTFSLTSNVFNGTVSGRDVRRSFALAGEVLNKGEILQGLYTEVITGFTPRPMVMRGIFMVTRPSQAPDLSAPASLDVNVNPQSVLINGNAAISITLLNGYRQPVTQTTFVTMATNLGTITPSAGNTDSHGVISATFIAGNTPGMATIMAATNNITGTAQIEVKGYSPAALTLTSTATLLPVSSGQTIVTATLHNQMNQPMQGAVVSFTGTLGQVSPVTTTTNANGVAVTTFSAGPMPGLGSVTAKCSSLTKVVSFQSGYTASQCNQAGSRRDGTKARCTNLSGRYCKGSIRTRHEQ